MWLGIILLVGLAASSFAFAFSYLVSGWSAVKSAVSNRQISVSGEGKISVKPDIAIFYATVITYSKKVGEAQDENSRKSNAVADYLKKSGVQEKDLRTLNYSISPQYQYFSARPCTIVSCPPSSPPQIVSYEVRNTLEVKVRDFTKLDDLLQGVVENGANEIGSINFSVDNPKMAQAQARKKAIDDAKSKAEVLARDLGVRLVKIINFSESGSPVPIYNRQVEALGLGGGIAASPAPAVQPGEQEIQSNITITYEFR